MKRALTRSNIESPAGIRGDLTGIEGDLSGITGNIDDCLVTADDRVNGIDIEDLIKK